MKSCKDHEIEELQKEAIKDMTLLIMHNSRNLTRWQMPCSVDLIAPSDPKP